MHGYNGKSVGYFPSFCKFYFCAKWLVYACMVTYTWSFLFGVFQAALSPSFFSACFPPWGRQGLLPLNLLLAPQLSVCLIVDNGICGIHSRPYHLFLMAIWKGWTLTWQTWPSFGSLSCLGHCFLPSQSWRTVGRGKLPRERVGAELVHRQNNLTALW